MEKQLNIASKLSLQEMALRRVVIHLWNEDTILECFLFDKNKCPPEHHYGCNDKQVQEYFESFIHCNKTYLQVTETVKHKVIELSLPISIKKRMFYIIKIIGAEILRWKISLHSEPFFTNYREYLDINGLKQICWTSAGVVDYKKTAEKLVCLETLNIVKRFRLACSHYLVNNIPSLWKQLPAKYKKGFNKKYPMQSGSSDVFMTKHEVYWFCLLIGIENKLDSWGNQKGFEFSASEGNEAATEYYFQKLTDEERDQSLLRVATLLIQRRCRNRSFVFPVGNLSKVLHNLLSKMSPAEQIEVFAKQPCHFLRCFLDWPCHDLFMDILDLAEDYIAESDYKSLFSYSAENVFESGYYFPKLFQSVFLCNSRIEKRWFEQSKSDAFIREFLFVEDVEPLLMILRNIARTDIENLLTSDEFFESLDDLVMRDKFDVAKVFLREAFRFMDRKIMISEIMKWLRSKGITSVELRRIKRKWKDLYESININDANTL